MDNTSREITVDTVVIDEVYNMNIKEVYELAQLAHEFKSKTSLEVGHMLLVIQNLRNKNEDGVIKGVSNRHICSRYNVNTYAVHEALHNLGWIDDKKITMNGFKESNKLEDNGYTVDIMKDTLVLDFHNGSLYWNDESKEFNEAWEKVMNTETEYGRVSKTTYNSKLKSDSPVISKETIRMLQEHNKSLLKDGVSVTKRY